MNTRAKAANDGSKALLITQTTCRCTNRQLEKITGIQAIVRAGAMKTQALVADGQVKLHGRVPSVDELKTILA